MSLPIGYPRRDPPDDLDRYVTERWADPEFRMGWTASHDRSGSLWVREGMAQALGLTNSYDLWHRLDAWLHDHGCHWRWVCEIEDWMWRRRG